RVDPDLLRVEVRGGEQTPAVATEPKHRGKVRGLWLQRLGETSFGDVPDLECRRGIVEGRAQGELLTVVAKGEARAPSVLAPQGVEPMDGLAGVRVDDRDAALSSDDP